MQLNKSNTPIAVDKRSKFSLPQDYSSSQKFMLLQPVMYKRMLKTERINVNQDVKIIPEAMVCPTFGRSRYNLRSFFVPYNIIFPNWYSFIENSIAHNFNANSIVSTPPYFTANDLMTLFTTTSYGLTEVVTSGNYNFKINNILYKFTQLGRYFNKILYNLGYSLVGKTPADGVFNYNALNLLAYARIYCDWYANSQYLNSADYLRIERYFKFNNPTYALHLTDSDLYYILLFIRPSVYESNGYFEAAWDNPTAPSTGNFSQTQFTDIISQSAGTINVSTSTNGIPYMQQSSASVTLAGTQYLHDALKKMTDAYRRHAIAGARAIDRVLLSYGVMPPSLRLERSVYCGNKSIDIDIQSIFATANGSVTLGSDTFKSVTGDRSGAGLGRGNAAWDFTASEDGVFMVIGTIQPSGGYYQGYDRINRHMTREEFFIPEYDSLSVQSIEKGEVYISSDFDTFSSSAINYAGHFGFTSRYGEYKRSINRVSGDLADPVIIAGGDAWHLNREFNDAYFNNSVANIVHSEDFARGTDALQYDRLFYFIGDDKDHYDPFKVFVHSEMTSYAPMSSLFESYEFDSDGQKVTTDVNGAKVN